MFLGYAQNHTISTHHMLNLCTKRIVIRRDVIWPNKTYGEYVSREKNIKAKTYILQDKDKFYHWANVKIGCINTEVRTEDVKTGENVNTKQDYRGGEDVQNTIKIIYFFNTRK